MHLVLTDGQRRERRERGVEGTEREGRERSRAEEAEEEAERGGSGERRKRRGAKVEKEPPLVSRTCGDSKKKALRPNHCARQRLPKAARGEMRRCGAMPHLPTPEGARTLDWSEQARAMPFRARLVQGSIPCAATARSQIALRSHGDRMERLRGRLWKVRSPVRVPLGVGAAQRVVEPIGDDKAGTQ